MKKKVLIITYYWPPASSPGVQRWLKFSKYMVEEGLEPVIVTVSNASYPFHDETLEKDVPENLKVIKTKSIEPILIYNLLQGKKTRKVELGLADIKEPKSPLKKLAKVLRSNVFIPDAKIGWYYNIRNTVLRLVKSEKIENVITTGPPHSTHLIGRYVKSNVNINWIADFRDPWTKIYYERYLDRSDKAKARNLSMERSVLQQCDHIITVSEGLKRDFSEFAGKISVIPNGFDEDDIPTVSSAKTDKFYLVYTGNLKINQDIPALYAAVSSLVNDVPEFKDLFSMKFIGAVNEKIKASIKESGLDRQVEYLPFVQHLEAVKEMIHANCLYLPIPHYTGNESIVTGKIYEYLASRTPILSIGPLHGDAAKILAGCNRFPMLDYGDEEGIRNRLQQLFCGWKENNGFSLKHNDDSHLIYSRQKLTRQVVDLL